MFICLRTACNGCCLCSICLRGCVHLKANEILKLDSMKFSWIFHAPTTVYLNNAPLYLSLLLWLVRMANLHIFGITLPENRQCFSPIIDEIDYTHPGLYGTQESYDFSVCLSLRLDRWYVVYSNIEQYFSIWILNFAYRSPLLSLSVCVYPLLLSAIRGNEIRAATSLFVWLLRGHCHPYPYGKL